MSSVMTFLASGHPRCGKNSPASELGAYVRQFVIQSFDERIVTAGVISTRVRNLRVEYVRVELAVVPLGYAAVAVYAANDRPSITCRNLNLRYCTATYALRARLWFLNKSADPFFGDSAVDSPVGAQFSGWCWRAAITTSLWHLLPEAIVAFCDMFASLLETAAADPEKAWDVLRAAKNVPG